MKKGRGRVPDSSGDMTARAMCDPGLDSGGKKKSIKGITGEIIKI